MDEVTVNPKTSRRKSRGEIGRRVRALRQDRRWTQAELAKHLELSQARLSEIERGGGSFTAEQFLQILRIFNVSVTDFEPSLARDPHAELQNVLAHLGASHLHESERALPSEQLRSLNAAVREALLVATPRLLTALGPVLVRNIDRVNLRGLYQELKLDGLERRLAWLIESVCSAVSEQLPVVAGPPWSKHYRRAAVILGAFVEFLHEQPDSATVLDVLDGDIRSAKSLAEVQSASSAIARRWRIVTGLQLGDFTTALRSARAAD